MAKAYISLGSNLGNRIENLRRAVELLRKVLTDTQESIILETDALLIDGMPQDWNIPYLNMIVCGNTSLKPLHLLKELKSIERQMGRPEEYRKWSPRIIDLDILLYGGEQLLFDNLTIPHPELHNRLFLQHLLASMDVDGYDFHINSFKKSMVINPAIMGIVNVTDDSFSDGGRYSSVDRAIQQVLKLADDGASVVDIGAQSTRPGAVIKGPSEEIKALKPVLDELKNFDSIAISIDTFHDEVVKWVLNNYNVAWINDVKGSLSDETIELIVKAGVKLCVMHSLSVPPVKNITIPTDADPIAEIITWGHRTMNRLVQLGVDVDNIVIDPGIGFGKTIKQNLNIINRIEELKQLGVKTLLGHSRKSYISAFTNSIASERDIETIMISALVTDKVDFLRVHNVSDHMKGLVANKIT